MGETLRNGLSILGGLLLILTAIRSLPFWVRTRFWFPKYVHVMAAIGAVVMLWCLAGAPASKDGPLGKLLFVASLPAIIYFIFLLYGGQRAAYSRHFEKPVPCPQCKLPVPARYNTDCASDLKLHTEGHCSHCGQSLPSQQIPSDR
jgi:hypothetical protein